MHLADGILIGRTNDDIVFVRIEGEVELVVSGHIQAYRDGMSIRKTFNWIIKSLSSAEQNELVDKLQSSGFLSAGPPNRRRNRQCAWAIPLVYAVRVFIFGA